MYCLNMLAIALELARSRIRPTKTSPAKFFEHFVYIAHAIEHAAARASTCGTRRTGSTTTCSTATERRIRLKVRSMVGLIPLFAVETLEPDVVDKLPGFKRRMQWFIDNHPEFREHVEMMPRPGVGHAAAPLHRRIASSSRAFSAFMLDETRVPLAARHPRHVALSPGASLHPPARRDRASGGATSRRSPRSGIVRRQFQLARPGLVSDELPADRSRCRSSTTSMATRSRCEFPTGSATDANLWEVAAELSRRLTRIFLRDADGAAAGVRRTRDVPARSALAGPHPVSTNTSTATTARASAPATRPAGRGSSPSCSSRAASGNRSPRACSGGGASTRARGVVLMGEGSSRRGRGGG